MTDQTIRAIETTYNGRLYRSRLEARWAVMLDTLKVRFEYENEGYETPHGRYLPDFWLPDAYMRWHGSKGVLLEIKPEDWDEAKTVRWVDREASDSGLSEYVYWQTNTEARLEYVAVQLNVGALLVRGLDADVSEWVQIAPGWDAPLTPLSCDYCHALTFRFSSGSEETCPKCKRDDNGASQVRIAQALHAARTYRFW